MGLLSRGTPLSWEEALPYQAHVRAHGVEQFLHLYRQLHTRSNDVFRWGDEVEYMVVRLQEGTARVVLRAADILEELQERMDALPLDQRDVTFHPEYARYMIETTPGRPYANFSSDLESVEKNMVERRRMIMEALHPHEVLLSMCAFPIMGAGEFAEPWTPPGGPVARSPFVPDNVTNAHPRFPTLTQNIRQRRGAKVCITMPLFQDEKTAERLATEPLPASEDDVDATKRHDCPEHIYMDCMAFGMGCCCLQVTFQARNVREARYLYDQLAVLSPLLMALSAGTPVLKGLLSDNDVRWSVIAQAVDCRTPGERGLGPLQPGEQRIAKSRYDSISSYIGLEEPLDRYNDTSLEIDEASYQTLVDGGIDPVLAQHIAHLFIRDALVIFSETVEQDDTVMTDHFENIQSTNWQCVRFKPPPVDSDIGWRVEFRSIEVQFTEFENAAFTVLIALLSRAILFFDLNLYIPISKLDENMDIAHRRQAVTEETFYFRKKVKLCKEDDPATYGDYTRMSLSSIMNGDEASFPGLLPIVRAYLDRIGCRGQARKLVDRYLCLIEGRSTGRILTPATWMRNFVQQHPDYRHDSVVSETVCHDLLQHIDDIVTGKSDEAPFLGDCSRRCACECSCGNEFESGTDVELVGAEALSPTAPHPCCGDTLQTILSETEVVDRLGSFDATE